MEWFFIIVILIIALFITLKILAKMKDREIIECGSCGNRMTKGNFKRKGGCPRCGSDLIVHTGERAK